MKIVIEKESLITVFAVSLYAITGGDYKDIKETVTDLVEKMEYTTLPEGHGRLIDANWLKTALRNFSKGLNREADWEDIYYYIDATPTIIESDKEGEQGCQRVGV